MDLGEKRKIESEIRKISEEIITEKINITEGVRKLEPLLINIGIDMLDDLRIIKAVDSDSDDYPMGEVRRHWNKEKLAKLDEKRKEFEDFYKKDILEACNQLIAMFK